MRTTSLRILKHGSLVAGALIIFGMMFGQIAGMWVSSQTVPRTGPVLEAGISEKANLPDPLAEGLKWRMPLAMAGWGFGIVTVFELLGGMWRKPSEGNSLIISSEKATESEDLVQQFLREAEANATNLADTPAPAMLSAPNSVRIP